MLRSINSDADRFLEGLRTLSRQQERAVRQVSSGERVERISDDPDAVTQILQIRAQSARVAQIEINLGRLETETGTAENALQQAVKLMDRVRSLGAAATGMHQTADTRAGLAGEIADILVRLTGLANTESGGRFIFSGDADGTPALGPFDFAQTPPWGAYQGAAATRRAEHPTGILFDVSRTAGGIFTHADPARNVLQRVEDLRQALLANDDQAIRGALAPLAGVSAHLNSELMFYGNVQTQLAEASETAARMQTRLEAELSALEDADAATAITEMQQARFHLHAALGVRGRIPRTSLFDFLR
jgi:flagellar hook-associated protein 3 FlgL